MSMLVRTVLVICCLARASVQAQATPDPQTQSRSEGDTAQGIREAVPVDHAALLSPSDLPPPAHHDIEADPLFVPGLVLTGAGTVVLLGSLLTGVAAHSMYGSLERECMNNVCYGNHASRIDSGHSLAVVSTVLTGVGVGAAGLGVALLIIAATREQEQSLYPFGLARLRLTGGPSPLGIGAMGSF